MGKTWQDEVYYLHYGKALSGNRWHIVLEDDTIVSVVPTCDKPEAHFTWNEMVGNTDFTVICWKPVPSA